MANQNNYDQDKLIKVFSEIKNYLGFSHESQLWEAAGIDPSSATNWYKLISPTNSTSRLSKKRLDSFIEGLETNGYKLPSAFKKALYEAIGTPIEIRDRRGGCPTPPLNSQPFVGRTNEIGEIKTILITGRKQEDKSDNAGIKKLGLQGMGGMGKTSLAIEISSELQQKNQFQAVIWKTIGPNPEPLNALLEWARLGDPEFQYQDQKLPDLADLVRSLLEGWLKAKCPDCLPFRTLIVFDDVWEDGFKALKILERACPSTAKILITTRSKQLVIDLDASLYSLSSLVLEDGKALLVRQFKYHINKPDPELMKRLVEVLGGHPLALTLAARRVLAQPDKAKALGLHVQEYEQKLPQGVAFDQMELERATSQEDENRSLSLVLRLSYEELEPGERAYFRALGILAFGQIFDESLLANVWDLEPAQVRKVANLLRLRGLIEQIERENDEEIWYQQHPLLQSFALNQLLQDQAEYQKYRQLYWQTILGITESFFEISVQNWYILDFYLPHIHHIGDKLVDTVAAGETSPTLLEESRLFATNVTPYLANRRQVQKLAWLEMGLKASQLLNEKTEELRFLNEIGTHYAATDEVSSALEYYQKALTLGHELQAYNWLPTINNNIGEAYLKLGEPGMAVSYLDEGLRLIEEEEEKNP